MIKRLRPAMSVSQATQTYATPHDHTRFGRGHGERVQAMIELVAGRDWTSAADLSCGNGAVLQAVRASVKYFGDFAPGWPIAGPMERTVYGVPQVELFIMGETLEHLDDPGLVLEKVEARSQYLLLSTPVEAWNDTNGEHYWAWDREGVEELLREASPSHEVIEYRTVDTREYNEPYCFGIWLVKL